MSRWPIIAGFILLLPLFTISAAAGPAPGVILESYIAPGAMAKGEYSGMSYRPRQFVEGVKLDDRTVNDAGDYAGWGVLNTRHRRDATLRITLNREATVGVLWIGGKIPDWLGAWTHAGDVVVDKRARAVYTRVLPAGEHELGGYTSGIQPYSLLFGEADGSAPMSPGVPEGREVPQPNQSCPAWVHDQYVATGTDGETYRTWHPQIDRVYWCYFAHEHGSNPEYFLPGYQALYDQLGSGASYAETKMGMVHEGHTGYKSYVFDGDSDSRWLITQHFGTGSIGRACKSHHSLDLAVQQAGALKVDLHLVADFGASRSIKTNQPMKVTACPENSDITNPSARFVPLKTIQDGYEPWRLVEEFPLFGLNTASLTFNTTDPILICDNEACEHPVTIEGTSGSRRLLQTFPDHGSLRIVAPDSVQANAGASSNGDDPICGEPMPPSTSACGDGHGETFYTDPMGHELRRQSSADAVQQFITAGTNVSAPAIAGKCWDYDGFGRPYRCNTRENGGNGARPAEREQSIGVNN